MSSSNVEVRLVRRPQGHVTADDFDVVATEIPSPGDGEVLVRTIYLSLDPFLRLRMSGRSVQHPLGTPMAGEIVGEIVASRAPGFSTGDLVAGLLSWSAFCVAAPEQLRRVDARRAPLSTGTHALGLAGATAYFGLFDVGRPTAGETVFVSSAAGSVGSLVGQMAKISGCRVVGSVGGPAKARRCLELGYDAVVHYREPDVAESIARACPDGIDLYFDNVGGEFADAVFGHLNVHGRVVVCGTIGDYESPGEPTGPRREWPLLRKRARMEGFSSVDYLNRYEEAFGRIAAWIRDGKLRYREEIVDGLHNAPAAFGRLFTGETDGKLMVRVGAEPHA